MSNASIPQVPTNEDSSVGPFSKDVQSIAAKWIFGQPAIVVLLFFIMVIVAYLVSWHMTVGAPEAAKRTNEAFAKANAENNAAHKEIAAQCSAAMEKQSNQMSNAMEKLATQNAASVDKLQNSIERMVDKWDTRRTKE